MMTDRPRHLLPAYERLRVAATMHSLAAAAHGKDLELEARALHWALLAGQYGSLWADEIEVINTTLTGYGLRLPWNRPIP